MNDDIIVVFSCFKCSCWSSALQALVWRASSPMAIDMGLLQAGPTYDQTEEERHVRGGRLAAVTTKDRLHKLVDELFEQEAGEVLRFFARRREDPMVAAFRDASEDDEPVRQPMRRRLPRFR